MKSGPCTYDSKYLSQIDRFCGRAVKYGYIAKFTPTAAGSEIKSGNATGTERLPSQNSRLENLFFALSFGILSR